MKNFLKLGSFAILIFPGFSSGSLTQEIPEAKIYLDLPNVNWSLINKQVNNGRTIYYFKRSPVPDDQHRQIVPNIAVIIEDVDKQLDALTFSSLKISKASFDITDVFINDSGKINFINAIGYRGRYIDKSKLDHTVYIVYACNEGKGIQFIFDTTTSIFDKIDNEFLITIKSIRQMDK